MPSNDARITKIQADFENLSKVATKLNNASNELTKVVSVLDDSLKRLNIGLAVWVVCRRRGEDDDPAIYNEDEVGYSKVNGTWGIAVRHTWGDHAADIHNEDGPWLFSDAPRDLRLAAIDKIPEVIEQLGLRALNTVEEIEEKTAEVRALASIVERIAYPNKPPAPPAPPNRADGKGGRR